MKARYLILTAISLLFTCAKAQSYESIKLYEGTDSAVSIFVHSDDVWVYTKDSVIILRRDIFEAGDLHRETKSNKNSKRSLEEIQTYSGKITSWHYERNYKYDGFYLQTGKDSLLVDFHSDLAARLMALKEDVEVSVVPKYRGKKYKVVRMLRVHDGKDTVYANMNPVFHKIHFNKENAIKGKGTIAQLPKKERGRYESCLLDNNVLLRFLFHAPKSISRKLKTGIVIEYTGQEDPLREGEVRAKDYKIFHCLTITIDGKEYVILDYGWMIDVMKL